MSEIKSFLFVKKIVIILVSSVITFVTIISGMLYIHKNNSLTISEQNIEVIAPKEANINKTITVEVKIHQETFDANVFNAYISDENNTKTHLLKIGENPIIFSKKGKYIIKAYLVDNANYLVFTQESIDVIEKEQNTDEEEESIIKKDVLPPVIRLLNAIELTSCKVGSKIYLQTDISDDISPIEKIKIQYTSSEGIIFFKDKNNNVYFQANESGKKHIAIIATDEAGNEASLRHSIEVFPKFQEYVSHYSWYPVTNTISDNVIFGYRQIFYDGYSKFDSWLVSDITYSPVSSNMILSVSDYSFYPGGFLTIKLQSGQNDYYEFELNQNKWLIYFNDEILLELNHSDKLIISTDVDMTNKARNISVQIAQNTDKHLLGPHTISFENVLISLQNFTGYLDFA